MMLHVVNLQGFCLSLIIVLILFCGSSGASLYQQKGVCSYKEKFYKPGESFQRGCDKCFCHHFGFYCFAPTKPTSWPKKCHQIRTNCGYAVVYKDNPLKECRVYSWIG